jgi:hemoglobin/transferrin/lactoferrin receptor protein
VADLSAWWKIDRRAQVTLALNNLFDKKYWLWSDIRQADARNPVGVDFYTQPGRNLSLALRADF